MFGWITQKMSDFRLVFEVWRDDKKIKNDIQEGYNFKFWLQLLYSS